MRPASASSLSAYTSSIAFHGLQNVKRVTLLVGIIVAVVYVISDNVWGDGTDNAPTDSLRGSGLFQRDNAVPQVHGRQLSEGMPTWETAVRSVAVGVLVFFSGAFAGLLLGLMGPEKNQLKVSRKREIVDNLPIPPLDWFGWGLPAEQILKEAGTDEEKVYATKIWEIRKKSNLLLCTLLVGNVAVNSLISIISAGLTSGKNHSRKATL